MKLFLFFAGLSLAHGYGLLRVGNAPNMPKAASAPSPSQHRDLIEEDFHA